MLCKTKDFFGKMFDIFNIFAENIAYGLTLEATRLGSKLRKNIDSYIPQFYLGFFWYSIHGHVCVIMVSTV